MNKAAIEHDVKVRPPNMRDTRVKRVSGHSSEITNKVHSQTSDAVDRKKAQVSFPETQASEAKTSRSSKRGALYEETVASQKGAIHKYDVEVRKPNERKTRKSSHGALHEKHGASQTKADTEYNLEICESATDEIPKNSLSGYSGENTNDARPELSAVVPAEVTAEKTKWPMPPVTTPPRFLAAAIPSSSGDLEAQIIHPILHGPRASQDGNNSNSGYYQ